jgi:hypothetical protein
VTGWTEAESQGRLGEIEGLTVSLEAAKENVAQLDGLSTMGFRVLISGGRSAVATAAAGFVFVAACACGSSHPPTVDISDLAKGGCPVPLAAAAGSATAVPHGVVETLQPGSTLAKINGLSVTCELTAVVNGSPTDLNLTLVVTHTAHTAQDVLLPVVQRTDFASVAELRLIIASADATAPGRLVPLPGDAPTAFAIVNIGGATSSAFVLAASPHDANGPEPTRVAIDAIASSLASQLG